MANEPTKQLVNRELSKLIGKELSKRRAEFLTKMVEGNVIDKKLAERINRRVWEQVL